MSRKACRYLSEVSRRPSCDVIGRLLGRGARLNSTAMNGWTPLMYAADNGHLGTANAFLLRSPALETRDRDGLSALMLAALEGHDSIVSALAQAGADVNTASKDGITPLMAAAILGREKVIKLLLCNHYDEFLALNPFAVLNILIF